MLNNLKSKITELAYAAVNITEDSFSSASGKEKKEAAIEYVISMLPIPCLIKGIASTLLSKFIDEAIEKAVEYMKKIKNSEE